MTQRVLITGTTGLLGSQILRQAPATLSVTATYHEHPLPSSYTGEAYHLDLGDADSVARLFRERRFDIVINCVGSSDVDRCETDQEYAQRLNVVPVRNLLEEAQRNSVRLISFSSDYVFDGRRGPYSESDQPNPVNYYGQTKLLAEECLRTADANVCTIRVCSLFAADPEAPRNLYGIIVEALKSGRVYRAADDLFSNPTEVSDLAKAIWQLVGMPELPRVLHLAGPTFVSRYDFAVAVAKSLRVNADLVERVTLGDLRLAACRPQRAGLRSDIAYDLIGRQLKPLSEYL